MVMKKIVSLMLVSLFLFSMIESVCALTATNLSQTMNLSQLANYATLNQVNIMLYDSNGLIESEFHTDGEKADYQVDKKTRKIKEFKNSNGIRTVLESNSDSTLTVSKYNADNTLISKVVQNDMSISSSNSFKSLNDSTEMIKKATEGLISSDLPQSTSQQAIFPMVSSSDYYSSGYNMSNMLPSIWTVAMGGDRLGRPSTAMTQTGIQNLLVSRNSVLKNSIQVWAKNSSGTVYNTGRVVTPSVVINNASINWVINPKVIIATIQKECGLITATSGDPKTRAFYFCMGYGATDGGDINSITGFDTQVDGGAHLLLTLWNNAFNLGQSGLPIQYVDSANISLRIDNCGTYALYQYTPWVSSNLLFLQVMKMFWPGSGQNGINWD